MPRPLSTDLRARIVAAYERGEGTYQEIAERFGVGEASVSRLLRRRRERDDLAPEPHGGGNPPLIPEELMGALIDLVAEAPDRTVEELCDEWKKRHGVRPSRSSMTRSLGRAGITRKRKRFRPSEQQRPDVEEKRERFVKEAATKDPERLVFLDESGSNIAMATLYGRAPRGERVVDYKPANWGGNITMVAAITLDGPISHSTYDGAMNKERFIEFTVEELCPVLRPGDIVVMDNLRAHHAPEVREAIENVGAELWFLPPYSPDLNPIELMWSVVKEKLRRASLRVASAVKAAFVKALNSLDSDFFPAWFDHCGYLQPN